MQNSAPSSEPVALAEHLAAHLLPWFPDLEGRVFAVTDVEDVWTKESAPRLPLCAVGIVEEEYRDSPRAARDMGMTTTLALMFAFSPKRYSSADGRLLPFWQFYNHERLRNRIKAALTSYRSPDDARVIMRRMDKDATEIAVLFTFTLEHVVDEFCLPENLTEQPRPIARITTRANPYGPPVYEPPPCEELDAPCDGCKEQTQP